MIIKTGTKVRLNMKWEPAQRLHQNAGVGTVVGKWGKNKYTVNFGVHKIHSGQIVPYEVVVEPENLIIVSATPKGYKHPKSPTFDKVWNFTRNLHGSGINYDWNVEETPTTFRASNSYDTMSESGLYDSAADFTVVFPKGESMGEFRLEFNGQLAQRMNQKYMLRDYLEDTIAYTLDRLHLR